MLTLVIDTATPACSVALIADGRVVARDTQVVGRGHAERLVPMIAALPGGGRADAILVDVGPGSFTGVRVGVAAAHGLGIGWGVPVHGVSSMMLIAAAALVRDPAPLMVLLEGGHGEVFAQGFARESSGHPAHPTDALVSLRPEAALRALAGRRAIGAGTHRLAAIEPRLAPDDTLPDAADAIHLPEGAAALPPRPLYGRAPDAKLPA